jgi:hypothetical protein
MSTHRAEVEHLAAILRAVGYYVSVGMDAEERIESVSTWNGPGFPLGHVSPLVFAECARKEVARREAKMSPYERHMFTHPAATISEKEWEFLQRVGRFGSDAYSAVKRGRSWWVDCCPSGFKTKTEAHAFVERYVDILLDKNAGRAPGTTAARREAEAAARARGEAVS